MVSIQQGFPHQRLAVVPRPAVSKALTAGITRRLTVTDAGHFPTARHHGMNRPDGGPETIVIVCVEGTGWAEIAGVRHELGPGQALVVPPSTPHAYGASPDDPWTIWWMHLRGSDVPELVSGLAAPGRTVVPIRNLDRVVGLIDEALSMLEHGSSPSDLVGAAGAAWMALTRIAIDRHRPEAGDPVERAIDYLRERLDRPVSVPELARLVGLSPSHLGARFRRVTGSGVLAHQTSLRMARARYLLDTTSASVAEIAREVGYADPLYFSRRFRQLHDASPTRYRSRAKG
jgi:AraC-like DNA-binding protein